MMRITTDRGTLFVNAKGKSVIRWKKGAKPDSNIFDKLQVFIDNTVVRNMDAYVPMRSGMLKKSVILGSHMGSGELIYIAPYAHKQYYLNARRHSSGQRGSKWFHRMWAARKDIIIREVRNYSRRLMS